MKLVESGEYIIETLEEINFLATKKKSICRKDGRTVCGKSFIPAAVLINMSGQVILKWLSAGLIIYKPKGK